VKEALDAWSTAAGIKSGPLFRCVCRAGKFWWEGISEKTVWNRTCACKQPRLPARQVEPETHIALKTLFFFQKLQPYSIRSKRTASATTTPLAALLSSTNRGFSNVPSRCHCPAPCC
jgi:hypothetical protein